jgi:uncharacterized protein
MKTFLGELICGMSLGFVLSHIGFTSFDEVHKMFVFQDVRMFLSFATAVILLVPALWLIQRWTRPGWSARPIHQGTIIGGVLFGLGWAISGACPGVVWIQIGEGQLAAVNSLAGMMVGNWLYGLAHERWFSWTVGSCSDI